jgi:hypothetical protein
MNDPLFFISLLVNAYDAPDRAEALQDAFEIMQRLGPQPGYEQAFAQLHAFLEEVGRQAQVRTEDERTGAAIMTDLTIIGLATDTFMGTDAEKRALTALIMSRPDWREKYECIQTDLQSTRDAAEVVEIILARENSDLAVLSFARGGMPQTITHVLRGHSFGHYSIRLSTGRVLWSGELRTEDLEWTAAFPGHALDLAAADIRTLAAKPTREIPLLDGEVVIRVFPGLEAGTVVITMNE